ncbi:ketoacyl-ACP synthase III [Streptomyces sp. CS090A]|uniref:beta-ketoacyl-ACP synthase 3 n=1 Tax=Streptomyces sp. CS090A TaxID=2162710 RepID=UPI000D51F59A|nr:beta-ketoacyl-ACP synthase 3 [Streptomyces sp. CS090A]PVC80412.1 ketoacyl-ACP synthase III [Streptomyces sp. CS090A]
MSSAPAYARLLSVGSYRPSRVLTNEAVAAHLEVNETWVHRRTGIRTRGVAGAEETLAYMGAQAANAATQRAGPGAGTVDCLIAASMTHQDPDASLARSIADLLPEPPRAALDVNAACAGFCVALELARCLIQGHTFNTVLVVGSERMRDIVADGDRATAPVFADGAGAVLLHGAPEPGIGAPAWGSDPAFRHLITRPDPIQDDGGPAMLQMQGPQVYRWVIDHLPDVAATALQRAGVDVRDLAAFIPHQSNDRIITALSVALDLPPHVTVARDITHSGNTAAASIPMAMDTLLHTRPDLSGKLALLLGYGAGITFAAQVVQLP